MSEADFQGFTKFLVCHPDGRHRAAQLREKFSGMWPSDSGSLEQVLMDEWTSRDLLVFDSVVINL